MYYVAILFRFYFILLFTKEQSVIKVNVIVRNYMYRSYTGNCRAPVALSVTLNNMKSYTHNSVQHNPSVCGHCGSEGRRGCRSG